MQMIFKLTGIDCPNCAAKLEKKLQKIDGVEDAAITFLTEKLTLSLDDNNMDSILEAVQKTVKKFEPDAVLTKL